MGSAVNLAVLQYYREVCDTGSIAKAAQRLSLSRQALSKAILSLEDEVGIKLFRRKNSGIELTAAGEVLYRHTQSILQDWGRTLEELEPLKWNQRTLLRVGYGQMTYNLWEAGHAETFGQAHPEVRLSYEILPPEQLLRRLSEGQLDLIISGDSGDPETTFSIPIRKLPPFLLLREDDPLARKEEVRLEDLEHRPVLLKASPRLSEDIRQAFQMEGIQAEFRPFPSHDPLTLLRIIRNTGAVYFDTKLHFLYRDLMEGLRAVPFRYEGPLPLSFMTIQATAPKEQRNNPVLRRYIRYLASLEPELTRDGK